LKKLNTLIMTSLNVLLVALLGIMFTIVLMNVILRYGFNSGLTWSEELARFMFVWMIFIGAIIAMKDDSHLKVMILVEKLPPYMRRAASIVVELALLYIVWLMLEGGWKITAINTTSKAPALGVPMSVLYLSSVVAAIGMAIVILNRLYKLVFGQQDSESTVGSKEETAAAGGQEAAQ